MVSAEPSLTRHDQCQRDPTLAVQKGRAIGFAAVIVLDADTRLRLRATRNQRIVDNLIHQFVWEEHLHQLQQTDGQVDGRYMRPFDQLAIISPVSLAANWLRWRE